MTEEMIICDRCTSEIPVGSSVCPACGAPIGEKGYETVRVDYEVEPAPAVEAVAEALSEPAEAIDQTLEEAVIPEPPPAPEIVSEPAPPPPPARAAAEEPPLPPARPAPPALPKDGKPPVGWIIGIVVALLLLCCCCLVVIGAASLMFMGM